MVRSLGDLTQGAIKAEKGFSGFSNALLSMADASSKASKRWTIFSRLVSGTPIWALQNKIRAYVDILAQIDQKTREVNESQLTSVNQTVEQMKVLKNVESNYKELTDAFEVYRIQEETMQATMGMSISAMAMLSQEQIDLLESTNAYHLAIAGGYSEFEAYNKALAEISNEYDKLENNVNKANKALNYQRQMLSKEGRSELRSDIRSQQDAIRGRATTGITFSGSYAQARSQGEGPILAGLSSALENTVVRPFASFVDIFKEDFGKFSEAWKKRTRLSEKMEKFSLGFQNKMLKLADLARPVFSLLFKYLVMAMFVSIGILAFIAAFEAISENFDILKVGEQIADVTATLYEVFADVINLVGAIFAGGDMNTIMEYLDKLLSSTLNLLFEVGILALSVGLASLIGLIEGLGKILFTEEYRSIGLSILSKFAKAFLILYFVRYLAIKMMEIAAIYAMPLLIAAAIAVVIVSAINQVMKRQKARATGGIVNESMTLVGERGPELVSLPRGSKVHTNTQSKNIGGRVTNNFNITINAKDTSDAELRRIAEKIGNMVNNKINRSFSSTTMR